MSKQATNTTFSKIYAGSVTHHRHTPRQHRFTYSLFMMYLDLDELPSLFDRFLFWSARRTNLAQFRRQDHLQGQPNLKENVLDIVERKLGKRPTGKVCLLTHLRYFGYVINPVSFYYCFDQSDDKVLAIVAEVHNTPWGEQHAYVLDTSDKLNQLSNGLYEYQHDKDFHVSPFLPMDMTYKWRLSKPTERLSVYIENWQASDNDESMGEHASITFNVAMRLTRKEINSASLAKCLLLFPLMTLKVISAIYYQALRLWLKKIPIHIKPQ